jgi:membrane-bound serine protease (ClpP class)
MTQSLKLLYVTALVWTLFALPGQAQKDKMVLVADADGPVTPVLLSFIQQAVDKADLLDAEVLVIRLNTPGGDVSLTKEIIQTIIASDVPVVVYVWPPGGFAASAGTFITLAGHGAAMAPNTSIGAASPVNSTGGEIDETMRAKIENILSADIRGLAERRGEKVVEWAQQTITEAKAASAQEALEIGAIDFIATDLDDLLAQMDGFTIDLQGKEVTLDTDNVTIEFLEATIVQQILSFIAMPGIALLLVSIGGLAITYEIINPGGYMSGVIGVICLLTGLYGLGQLPVNYAGLALILLAFILFVAELFTHTFGALTAAAITAFIIGALILFDTSEFHYELPWATIIGVPVGLALIFAFGISKIIQAGKRQPVTGQEGLMGAVGRTKTPLEPQGTVFVWGERWQATSEGNTPIPAGVEVVVTQIEGFRLTVKRRTGG